MFYTPNLLNDAHDSDISYVAVNTQKNVDTMLNNAEFMKKTLIPITFDENSNFRREL
jgi:acid phosphatase